MFNKHIQDLLRNSFRNNKDRFAIQEGMVELTYDDINNISDNIYNDNCKKISNKRCAIITNSIINRVVFMIAIIKGNGAFINIDSNTPDKKVFTLLDNINPANILTDDINIKEKFDYKSIIYTSYEKMHNSINRQDIKKENEVLLYNDELYVAFTSGTTGIPKLISGRNISLAHFINWQINKFKINYEDVFAQITTPNFDVFLRDIFTPLCAGSKIMVPPKEYLKNFRQLLRWIYNNKITSLHCTPSILETLLNTKESEFCFELLHNLFLAGEKVTINLMKKWYSIKTESNVYGFYGPTETTLAKVFCEIKNDCLKKEYIPLGVPIDDTTIYIKNEQDLITKDGDIGEIHISTKYSSFGYIQNEDLNNEKFYNDINTGNIIYRTGDRAIRYPNGDICFIGRNDRQIKINGIRCELDEIEFYIENNHDIQSAAVLFRDDNETLICFYVESNKIIINALIEQLSDYLPSALIPKSFVRLEYMPLNINGKKDYQRLLLGEFNDNTFEKTNNDTNKIISAIEKVYQINLSNDALKLKINTLIDSLEYLNNLIELEKLLNIEFNEEIYIADTFEKLIKLINNL